MKLRSVFGLLALVSLVSACTSKNYLSEEEKATAYQAFIDSESLVEVKKIMGFRYNGWASLGEQHLVLYKNSHSPYLITLKRRCYDLDFTQAIKVHTTGSVLYAKYDAVSVPDGIEVKCFIDTIHELTKEQKKALFKIGKPQDHAMQQDQTTQQDNKETSN